MNKNVIVKYLADVHNELLDIETHGESTIRMAQVIMGLRNQIQDLQSEEE